MGHSVTLGGERVGSGNKNKVYLHNYERSTHNLSEKFTSTMGVGMLIPFMCKLATRDDKFEIDLSAGLRTIPTKGPLFGSFKLQLDVYQCPLRLYQALLHNNPLAIGLKANQVKFPKMRLFGSSGTADGEIGPMEAAKNSLVRYLGIAGIGSMDGGDGTVFRDMFSAGLLAYYDIFKNYYANKQEEYAYTCTSKNVVEDVYLLNNPIAYGINVGGNTIIWSWDDDEHDAGTLDTDTVYKEKDITSKVCVAFGNIIDTKGNIVKLTKEELLDIFADTVVHISYTDEDGIHELTKHGTIAQLQAQNLVEINFAIDGSLQVKFKNYIEENGDFFFNSCTIETNMQKLGTAEVVLKKFLLKNIDDMRMNILSFHTLGQSFLLNGEETLAEPYISAIGDALTYNWQKPLSGLCVKTYQSDMFNNWINTEWIDGENGIAAITAISTSDGKITIDALNFSEKLYNLLNRIAVSGATYEDYLDAAYTDSAKKFCEAPMWIGGMSDEIVFEEIVQTANGGEENPLGTLAGRGNLLGKKRGGKITCKIDEPSLIIGIVSITPRINYTQGNEWFNTEIDSLMDIHVPAMDGVAFQNLIGERLHFASTIVNDDGTIEERPVIGKIPAWLEYMTSVDKAYGDFAATEGDGYMVLNRDYLCENGVIKDATTYIDPAKYNYAFAYTKRDAQNFWVQIYSKISARRLMSAKQIPNV